MLKKLISKFKKHPRKLDNSKKNGGIFEFNRLPKNFLVSLLTKINNPQNLATLKRIHRRTRNVMGHPNYERRKLNLMNRRNLYNLILSNNNNPEYTLYKKRNNNRYEYRLLKKVNPQRLIRVNQHTGDIKLYPQPVERVGQYVFFI